jgi:two-component system chemotaxis response regulator CheY
MKRILVVDDSATSRLLFRAHLPKDREFQVVEADDLASALSRGREVQPDLVFLDYNMPEKNGTEIACALREGGVDAPLYLLTANTQESVLHEAEEAGIRGVLEKPITADKLRNVLEEAGV